MPALTPLNLLLDSNGAKVSREGVKALEDSVKTSPSPKLQAALGLLTLRKNDRKKQGVRLIREALAGDPTIPGLHHRLALALQERTPADAWARNEALSLYRTSLRIDPADDGSYYQLGVLRAQLDGKDEQGKPLKQYSQAAHSIPFVPTGRFIVCNGRRRTRAARRTKWWPRGGRR
jgi:tetratricopeptide (TPR) repeat protein